MPFSELLPMKNPFPNHLPTLPFPHLLVLHSGTLDTPDPHKEDGPDKGAVK